MSILRDSRSQAYVTRPSLPKPFGLRVLLTVRHLLVECPSLIDLRHRYLYRRRGRDSGVYYISKVLGLACLAPGHDVYKYLGDGWIDFI
ncbi:hypothetical protein E2C01_079252 [Portunus trituberculatus]|uniref:Uncharacterized protein n=1 Tax=Portunus trituberculatus TaxID=210409 RepID=A0A5B7IQ46_PORTR|nr:hypothetical protein [Portunus trituberculatus]